MGDNAMCKVFVSLFLQERCANGGSADSQDPLQGAANFFCGGQDSKYFWFYEPNALCLDCSVLLI